MTDDLVERVARAILSYNMPSLRWKAISPSHRKMMEGMARAAIAEVYRWQPIETAPRDGTVIIARNENQIGSQAMVYWDDPHPDEDPIYRWRVEDGPAYHKDRFTHWLMPPEVKP